MQDESLQLLCSRQAAQAAWLKLFKTEQEHQLLQAVSEWLRQGKSCCAKCQVQEVHRNHVGWAEDAALVSSTDVKCR